jgi:uncharacterized membrane protein YfcA
MAGTLMILLLTLPVVGRGDAAALTVLALSAVTTPWALWRVFRQWRTDRRCAMTYAVVALVAASLLWQLTRIVS